MCVAFAAFLLLFACLVVVGPVSLGSQQDPVKRCMRSLEQFRQELICILDRDTRVLLDQVAVSKVDRISFAECIPSQPQQILRNRYTEPHADKERNKHLQGYIFCTPCIVIKLLNSGQSGLIQQAFFAKFFLAASFRFEQIAKDFVKTPCSQLDLRAILLQLFTKLQYITVVQLRYANQLSFIVPMPEV